MSGASASERVLPGTSVAGCVVGVVGAVATVVGGGGAGGAEVASAAGGASGTARAVAHETPIEEARNPRMPQILNILRQICLFRN